MSDLSTYIEWKWSDGKQYEKTLRTSKKALQETHSSTLSESHPTLATVQTQTGFTRQSNKRDDQNAKLSERCLMIQKNVNPFLDASNYVNDLMLEDSVLRPKDSNV